MARRAVQALFPEEADGPAPVLTSANCWRCRRHARRRKLMPADWRRHFTHFFYALLLPIVSFREDSADSR